LGGDSTTVYLPVRGNFRQRTHLAIELNDEQIADLIEDWIKQHVK
jgi:DNA-binding ferritin-like protein